MNATKIAAIAFVVGGVLALAYGGFSFTKQTHQAKLGPIELAVKEKETVDIPTWAGIGAVAVGVVLLAVGGRSR